MSLRAARLEGKSVRGGGQELAGPGAPCWIDLDPSPENLAWLSQRFGFHPLALEDCANQDQRPKFEEYPKAIFAVIHRLGPTPDESDIFSVELHAFLTPEALITVHGAPIAELDRVFERCAGDPELLERGPGFLWYLLCDAITDAHFAVADAFSETVDELAEEATAEGADGDFLRRIMEARHRQALLRRRLAPQREVFAALARPGDPRVDERTSLYFRDVLDHLLRITDQIDVGRDLIGTTIDAYLANRNDRMTQVMTRLTVIATIFLPLNFMAGFFGMNLSIVPAHTARVLIFSSMIAVPVVMVAWFKRRRWL
jgi:magnesium transporter